MLHASSIHCDALMSIPKRSLTNDYVYWNNNVSSTSTFTLRTHLLAWTYEVEDVQYEPDLYQDVYQARSWIRRTYTLPPRGRKLRFISQPGLPLAIHYVPLQSVRSKLSSVLPVAPEFHTVLMDADAEKHFAT